jgi:hypothetical protein
MTNAANQTAKVSVISKSKNTVVTIKDVGDTEDKFEFLTTKGTADSDNKCNLNRRAS